MKSQEPQKIFGIAYYSEQQFADGIDKTPTTLKRWRRARPPKGPKVTKIGRKPFYAEADVQAWLRGPCTEGHHRHDNENFGRRGQRRPKTENIAGISR